MVGCTLMSENTFKIGDYSACSQGSVVICVSLCSPVYTLLVARLHRKKEDGGVLGSVFVRI